MSNDSKIMLQRIAATLGIKEEIVREVWEFTLFTMLLDVAGDVEKNPDGFQVIEIPYFGKIRLKDNGIITDENGEAYHDIQPLVAMSDTFKKLYSKVCKGQYSELSEFLEENYIKPVIQEIK